MCVFMSKIFWAEIKIPSHQAGKVCKMSIGAKYDNFGVPDCVSNSRIMFTLLAKPTKNSTIFPAGSSILPSTAPTLPRVKNKVVSASGLTFLSKATSWNYLEKIVKSCGAFKTNKRSDHPWFTKLIKNCFYGRFSRLIIGQATTKLVKIALLIFYQTYLITPISDLST